MFIQFSVAWDKLVMQCFLVVYHEYPTRDLIFLCIHTRQKACVYTKKNQVTRGIFMVYHKKALHN